MAMPLCARALRLCQAARILRGVPAVRRVYTAPRLLASSSSVTSSHDGHHQHLGPEEPHEEEVDNVYLKNPDSFGYDEDPVIDLWNARVVFLFGVTLCLVFGPIFVYYLPDPRMNHWARREAERLVKLRQAQGLPLIEEDYYDPASLVLPDDE
ncbi:NADH dehydrogenase [ubiquinone] 1 beta subcomplex subunit 11, mitochondrial [Gastrophryne carolinensis]